MVGKTRLSAVIAAAGLGVLGVGYGAVFAFTGGKIPGDTTVLGIPLGGLSQDEAKEKLSAGLTDRAQQPLRLTAGGKTYTVKPADAGLRVDVDATVTAAGAGRSADPRRMWHVLTGGSPVDPVVAADEAKLDQAVEGLVKRVNRQATEGSITFVEGKAVQHPPADGVALDRKKAADSIRAAFPASGEPVALPVSTSKPKVSGEAVAKAMKEYAEPATSGPIKLTVGEKSVTLQPGQLTPGLKLTVNDDGTYTPTLDMAKLEPMLKPKFAGLESRPKDATIEISGGKPRVVPAVDGKIVARAKVMPAILATLPKPAGQRTAAVGLTAAPAKFTTAAAQKLGVTEVIGQFTTEFPHAAYRNTNIGTAARRINGTLLKPNETFSLNKIVGERTKENGFVKGGVINNGVLVEDLGGGVSQSATTTYNAAFFAGLKDVQHKAHSFYISRYPVGREATVAWPSVDLKFLNNSGHGVLVETLFKNSTPGTKGAMTTRIWGTKTWTITAGKSATYNHRAPKVIYTEKPGCKPQSPVAGFDIKVYRYFNRDGQRVKTETITTKYNAADDIRCGKKPAPPPPPTTPPPTPPSAPPSAGAGKPGSSTPR